MHRPEVVVRRFLSIGRADRHGRYGCDRNSLEFHWPLPLFIESLYPEASDPRACRAVAAFAREDQRDRFEPKVTPTVYVFQSYFSI